MNWIKGLCLALILLGAPTCAVIAATLPENTTAVLAGGATFTSDTYETNGATAIIVTTISSHDSATDGIKVDQSFDNDCVSATSPTFQYSSLFTYSATAGQTYVVRAIGKCFRVRYVNGGTLQDSFDLTTNLWGF